MSREEGFSTLVRELLNGPREGCRSGWQTIRDQRDDNSRRYSTAPRCAGHPCEIRCRARVAPDELDPHNHSGLQIDVIRDGAALASLAPEWDTLFARAAHPAQVFQTHAFAALYARIYQLERPQRSAEFAIVTARSCGRLVLVWPMVMNRRSGLVWLSWLGEPISQYGDALIDPALPRLELLHATYDHVRNTLAPDAFRLRKVRADAAIAPFLSDLGMIPAEVVEAPCVTLAAGGSAFESRQSGKAMKNRRRLMRRLEERGTVEFRELTCDQDAATALTLALADKRDWLERRALVSPALGDPRLDVFLRAALADPNRATGCAAFELKLDGRQIAFALGFRCKGRLMLHMITYAADAEKSGAGILNLEAILQRAEAEGLEALDLLPPKAEYKLDWADQSIPVASYTWGVSAYGRLAIATLDHGLVPRLKTAIATLPFAARRALAARTLRGARARG